MDESKKTDENSQFVEENKINYTIMRADEKILSDYFGSNPHRLPLLKLIDKNGMIVDSHDGYEAGALEKS